MTEIDALDCTWYKKLATSAVYADRICASVCQVGVLQRRLNLGSHRQRHDSPCRDSVFLVTEVSAKFQENHTQQVREIKVG